MWSTRKVRRAPKRVADPQVQVIPQNATPIALKDWTIDISGAAGRTVVAVAPRLPNATDLQRLDEARDLLDPAAEALLVHATRRIDDERMRHLRWVTGGRQIDLVPENAIGAHW